VTATADPRLADDAIRDVTDAEAAAFQRDGWVKLPNLIDAGVVLTVLDRLKAHMGEGAEGEVDGGYDVKTPRPAAQHRIFTAFDHPSRHDEYIRELTFSKGIGRVIRRCGGGPMRYWGDGCFVKMPVTRDGGATPRHQDWVYDPFDRGGSLTLWIALVDIPPEMGSMRFVNGSHRWGPLGRVLGRTDGVDVVDLLPQHLKDQMEVSPPLNLRAGDATVHDHLTIHSAPENRTDRLRWVLSISGFPAQTLYTGAPHRRSDDLGLQVNEPFDHPNFPVLAA
jgi:hypothetical protein